MFDGVPFQVWLLVGLAFFAWLPAQYIVRYILNSPNRRNITRPAEDFGWRTSGKFFTNLAALTAIAGTAVFIFTPQAERLVQSPYFFPALLGLVGVFALLTVARGLQTGRIEPLTRGSLGPFERGHQPKRYWASLAWNALLGMGMLWAGVTQLRDVPRLISEDECFVDEPVVIDERILDACRRTAEAYTADIAEDPRDFVAHYNRALAYENMGDTRLSLLDYSIAISLNPEDPDAYINRGLIHLDAQDFDLAIEDFARAHQLDPKDAFALANRGISLAWKGDQDAAASDFSAARSLDPDNIVVMRGETLLAMNVANFELAIDRATDGLRHHPDDLWLLQQRSDAYGRIGEREKAAADRARIIQLRYRLQRPVR
jgi:Tfp pilus assembly protein PilF